MSSTIHRVPEHVVLGVIGGSGLYSMPGFTEQTEVVIDTPFGPPSDRFITGKLEGQDVAFLARHGRAYLEQVV